MKKGSCVRLLLLMCVMLLAACGKPGDPGQTESPVPDVEEITLVVTEQTIHQLEDYPNLKKADLSGSTCYAQITDYAKTHPQVEVIYTVDLGASQPKADVETLTLESFDYDLLLENLRYFPRLRELNLPGMELTFQQLQELRLTYPELSLRYTVALLGQEISSEAIEADLSAMTSENVEEAAAALPLLPNLRTVKLSDEEGNSALSVEEVHTLQESAPEVMLDYTFDLFGQRISTTDERVEFHSKKIGDSREPELRQSLDIMKGCKYLLLEHCYFSDEVLAQLRDDYRDQTKIVWRIYFAKAGSCLTDRTVLRYVYNVTNSTVKQLKYCEDVEYIDFGHNEILSDWSWVSNMPRLKAIIVSGSIIKDLTPFENCKELEFLELSNCGLVTDLSPLSGCDSLKRLNISYTHVEDLSPLDKLPLECFVYVKPRASQEELDRFGEVHPECLTQYEGNEYGTPWRYEENGDPTPYYAKLQEVFHYPNATDTTW
ncbi:MAG: leucine-rich repeat domain-containing protein [Oscillospiraceae bacterium]|nr:leucine-rich repeat domain-containing protein [Oscillospiraceae bacterium]